LVGDGYRFAPPILRGYSCRRIKARRSAHSGMIGATLDLAWDDGMPPLAERRWPAHHRAIKNHRGSVAMSGVSRRHFLGLTGSAAVAAISGGANAAMGPNDKFDLVIKGGDVLDPSQSLRGKRDIGIRWGVIEA